MTFTFSFEVLDYLNFFGGAVSLKLFKLHSKKNSKPEVVNSKEVNSKVNNNRK